jgi:hypothetical protein
MAHTNLTVLEGPSIRRNQVKKAYRNLHTEERFIPTYRQNLLQKALIPQ